jgi:2-methylcitrate dehydratase PrpD
LSIQNFTVLLDKLLDLKWEDLSQSTIERTQWMIADTMFAAWYGIGSKELQNYVNAVGFENADAVNTIPIVGSGLYTTPYHHAIIHGTAIVSNELDEGNQFAKGHPAAHIFAPAFIAAIENNAAGSDFIRAFIIGYESAARLAYASNMKDDMHPHGTWGIIGGTVAAGILQKKGKQDIIEAALLAATLPLTTSWEAAVTGMTARNLYSGLGSLIAYQALQFQSFGFQSSTHVVDHVWGSLISERMNYDLFLQDLWSPPLLEKNYFKLYPSCRFSHSAIDALMDLLQDEQVIVGQVASVKVETYNLAARLDHPDPQNYLAAKFSIPFLLSTLLHGNTLFNSFNESVFFDPSIRSLAKEISVCEAPGMTALLPNKRAAQVTIKMKDGSQKKAYVDAASGGYEQSFPTARMIEKFKQMMASSLEEQQIEQIVQATMALDVTNQFKHWVTALQN